MLYGAYEGPKVFWLWTGGFFLSILWTVRILLFHPFSISKSGKWFLLWLFVLGVAGVVGIHPVDSLIGGNYRHQGLLFFFTLFLIGETIRQLPDFHKKILHILIGFGVVVESVIVLQQKLFDFAYQPLGTLGEPNAVAGFLAIGLFWIATFPRVKVWLRKILYFLTLIAIVVTGSKTGMAAALLISIGLGIQTLLKVSNKIIRIFLIGLGVFSIAVSCMYLFSLIQKTNPAPPFENRALYWKLGIGEFAKRPLLGYGLESTDVIYENAFNKVGVNLYELMIDRSHNIFLDIALWSGSIGLLTFGLWIYHTVRSLVGTNKYYVLIGLAAWMLFAFFQPVGVAHWLLLVVLLNLNILQAQEG
jgi:O-antigen ligase